MTTTYVPVLLERIADRPGLIGAVMLVNAAAGFFVPLVTGAVERPAAGRAALHRGRRRRGGGGLVAIALGTPSSYAVLALAAATVYVGLNAASTAHRALVAERFAADAAPRRPARRRARCWWARSPARVAGGALIDSSAAGLFVLWALALPLLALPTLAWHRGTGLRHRRTPGSAARRCACWPRSCAATVLGRSSSRRSCGSAAYAALTPFMVLYAEDVLGLRRRQGPGCSAGFGVLTGLGMLAARACLRSARGAR